MQHRAIRLMASKLAVAGIIEGNFTDEGLAAMSDCADMTTALARELTQGIKNEVEDLSAVFKKMAKLKTAPIVIKFPDDFDPFETEEEAIPEPEVDTAKPEAKESEPDGFSNKLPVFEYAGATENIDDVSKIFDELRIEKSADFPELEDGKRVSWTVEYGKISKSVPNPKGTSIGKMKSDIEASKEFTDSLKKRGADKNPTCKVKPRVTAQSTKIFRCRDWCSGSAFPAKGEFATAGWVLSVTAIC